jgi:hypothetical protein
LADFEEKEFQLKEVRARYIGISPGPSFTQHQEFVLTPEAIREMNAAEDEMHQAWQRFIREAEAVRR